jgi:Domain of unknown function (DUF4396)
MIDGILLLWFVFVALSLAYVAYDVRVAPIDWVQKLGWVLVVAYTGPIGLFFYLLTCRSPGKGLHGVYTAATWKQSVNSEVHCLAGDATGIIVAALVLSFVQLHNGTELVFEYVSAFIFGWVIFQAGMMKNMYDNYWQALKKTFFAETVSMNCVMVGMIPVMLFMMHNIENGRNPAHAAFWFSMGIATIVGGITAYPINQYLVANKLKHGCMTIAEDNDVKEHQHTSSQEKQQDKEHAHNHHEMGTLPIKTQWLYIGGTFALLLIAVVITSFFVPIKF